MTKIEELKKAKENTIYCLNNPNGSVDFHSLTYWARRVDELREEIRNI